MTKNEFHNRLIALEKTTRFATVTLINTQNRSNKVYTVKIEPAPGEKANVLAWFGPRGSKTLQFHKHTAKPVGLDDARKLLETVVEQKMRHGYKLAPAAERKTAKAALKTCDIVKHGKPSKSAKQPAVKKAAKASKKSAPKVKPSDILTKADLAEIEKIRRAEKAGKVEPNTARAQRAWVLIRRKKTLAIKKAA